MSKRLNKGQTLVETLVTILFIAISVIALIRFQQSLSYDDSLSAQRAEAATIAHSSLETLRDYHVLTTTSGYTAYQNIASGTSSYVGKTATFTITNTVTTFTNPDYKRLVVVVSWTDKNGIAQSVQQITNVGGIDPANSASVI